MLSCAHQDKLSGYPTTLAEDFELLPKAKVCRHFLDYINQIRQNTHSTDENAYISHLCYLSDEAHVARHRFRPVMRQAHRVLW